MVVVVDQVNIGHRSCPKKCDNEKEVETRSPKAARVTGLNVRHISKCRQSFFLYYSAKNCSVRMLVCTDLKLASC